MVLATPHPAQVQCERPGIAANGERHDPALLLEIIVPWIGS
jgi:hypothetical protein